ncbi:MAG: MarR family transcriptional regulator [Ahrensia sp.]|nr:MarR family transcriptional regulator [Ahrensia sp.]
MTTRAQLKANKANPDNLDINTTVSDLENLVGYNMKRAYVVIHKDFREALGENGISPPTFSALSLVVTYPQISQSNLARMLGIERSGLVSIIDGLEQQDYLARVHSPSDRRVQALVPTAEGVKAYHAMLATVQAHEDKLLAGLSSSEKSTLVKLLIKIRAAESQA